MPCGFENWYKAVALTIARLLWLIGNVMFYCLVSILSIFVKICTLALVSHTLTMVSPTDILFLSLLVYLTCNIGDFRTLLSPKITRYDIIEKYYRKHLVCYNTVKAGCVLMKQNSRDVCTKVFVRLKGENHSVHLKKTPCNYQEQWMLAINLNGNRYTSICRMSFSTSEISITVLAVVFSATASWIKRYVDISVIWL